MVRRLLVFAVASLAACHSDWRAQAITNAEDLVRSQVKNPSLQFSRVQFMGDDKTGQTCGYFKEKTADGGEEDTRFIVFIDGGGGQNPFIDDPSAPYPVNKDDFALNWRTQCQDLGYKE